MEIYPLSVDDCTRAIFVAVLIQTPARVTPNLLSFSIDSTSQFCHSHSGVKHIVMFLSTKHQ